MKRRRRNDSVGMGGITMSMQGDVARENDVRYLAEMVSKKIDENAKNPDVVSILKAVGREILDILPNVPDWARPYVEKFRP